jgi:hypothetical protein
LSRDIFRAVLDPSNFSTDSSNRARVVQEVGLHSDERPQSDLPSNFNGLILLIGYKDVPF